MQPSQKYLEKGNLIMDNKIFLYLIAVLFTFICFCELIEMHLITH